MWPTFLSAYASTDRMNTTPLAKGGSMSLQGPFDRIYGSKGLAKKKIRQRCLYILFMDIMMRSSRMNGLL
jgi:hypothetical protein